MLEVKKPPGPEWAVAIQRLINSGEAWKFPATYGRAAVEAIRDGRALLPPREAMPGRVGSEEFVKERMGEEYLKLLKEVV